MHKESFQQMDILLSRYKEYEAQVLDVGSFDVNGNFRGLILKRGWDYLGLDIVPGKNVDIVSKDLYNFPFSDNVFDIVMSGSTMEHVPEIWRWIPELVRILKPNGMLAIHTHTHWAYHPHPVDCWRIMPDGMKYLFDLTGCLTNYNIEMFNDKDISATAWKI